MCYKEADLLFTDGRPGRKPEDVPRKGSLLLRKLPWGGQSLTSVDPSWATTREPWKEASSAVHISGQHDSLGNILRDMMFSEKGETIAGCSGKVLGSTTVSNSFHFGRYIITFS